MVPTFAPRLARIALLPLILMTRPPEASAALGGTVTSVDADRVHVQGALMRIVQTGPVAMHELRSSSGTVFAVAWDGPWIPDLRQVLGDHFDHYQAAMRARQQARRARGVVAIDDAGLVVQMGGHPRAFTGRAYLTGQLPAGVQLGTIR